jgi:hypothetical protein
MRRLESVAKIIQPRLDAIDPPDVDLVMAALLLAAGAPAYAACQAVPGVKECAWKGLTAELADKCKGAVAEAAAERAAQPPPSDIDDNDDDSFVLAEEDIPDSDDIDSDGEYTKPRRCRVCGGLRRFCHADECAAGSESEPEQNGAYSADTQPDCETAAASRAVKLTPEQATQRCLAEWESDARIDRDQSPPRLPRLVAHVPLPVVVQPPPRVREEDLEPGQWLDEQGYVRDPWDCVSAWDSYD